MSGDITATQPPALNPGTIKRARKLLVASIVVLVLWISSMVWMYAKTVYPQRHPASAPVNQPGK